MRTHANENMDMALNKILIFSLAFLFGCTTSLKTRIIGGYDAKIEDYPYQVSLRVLGIEHFCGGAIISDRHILTAAHCLKLDFRVIMVHAGTDCLNKTGDIHLIRTVDIHPDWKMDKNVSYKNDIAVITLRDPIVFNEHRQKINLPSKNFENGESANLTGFGYVSTNPIVSPNQLQILHTNIITHTECQESTTSKVHEQQICTLRKKGFGPCNGDSGGPLAINGEIAGIVSWVDSDDCAVGTVEFYTNVYAYKDFIESIMNKTEQN